MTVNFFGRIVVRSNRILYGIIIYIDDRDAINRVSKSSGFPNSEDFMKSQTL